MTQEEKARAYDEALERAMVLRQEAIDKGYALDYIKDYETIFPELVESEDERVRKQLIDAIKIGRSNSGISFTEEAASRYIAWLEKHSEEQKDAVFHACNRMVGDRYHAAICSVYEQLKKLM